MSFFILGGFFSGGFLPLIRCYELRAGRSSDEAGKAILEISKIAATQQSCLHSCTSSECTRAPVEPVKKA